MNKETDRLLLFSSPWQKLDFFQGLTIELIHKLLTGSRHFQTNPKMILFKQDDDADYFGFVVAGLVRLHRKNPKGDRVIMDFAEKGSMIGGLLMAHPKVQYPITAQAISSGEFLKIPKQTYVEHWLNHPEIIRRTQMANMQRMQALQRTREIQKYPLDQKIAQILLLMSPQDNDNLFLKISKTDLADTVGACVESVIRIFSQWEKEGLIKTNPHGQEFIVRNEFQLRFS